MYLKVYFSVFILSVQTFCLYMFPKISLIISSPLYDIADIQNKLIWNITLASGIIFPIYFLQLALNVLIQCYYIVL